MQQQIGNARLLINLLTRTYPDGFKPLPLVVCVIVLPFTLIIPPLTMSAWHIIIGMICAFLCADGILHYSGYYFRYLPSSKYCTWPSLRSAKSRQFIWEICKTLLKNNEKQ